MPHKPALVERPHPDDRLHPDRAPQAMRRVTVNLRESPLAWLHARQLISDRQLAAGEKLRADYERAGLAAATTMRWDAALSAGARRGGGVAEVAHRQIDARRRFHAALECVGPGLADICWRVICAGEAMTSAERAMGWPTRSGRLVLTLALDRLAGFYGL